MSEEEYEALRKMSGAISLDNRCALVRAFANSTRRKTPQELREFLFLDEDDLAEIEGKGK
jgi:hypothetical protein